MSQSSTQSQPAKICFSRVVAPGEYEDLMSVDEATGITLWRNSESTSSWKKLVDRMKNKFGEEFHEYASRKDCYIMLRNRERDAREVLGEEGVPF